MRWGVMREGVMREDVKREGVKREDVMREGMIREGSPDGPTTPPPQDPTTPSPHDAVARWYAARGWTPFPFQEEAWAAYAAGASGLIHAPTGMGKSYAAWFGPLQEWMMEHPNPATWTEMDAPPLTVLWITPLRALATDTTASLLAAVDELGLPWTVEKRTGDTSSSAKSRQREHAPTALVTTPESLSLLLSYPESRAYFRHVRSVVVDEWHELLGSKRGTQTELALARLRAWQPELRVWGLSATLGNLDQALAVLMGAPERVATATPPPRL
ncbi:MAG: DEAD/DEAH box helicase, partial [Caldilineaceae bacterium]|nr:DEAD/DEAH box helicase [Caldilineaceae bacterium]